MGGLSGAGWGWLGVGCWFAPELDGTFSGRSLAMPRIHIEVAGLETLGTLEIADAAMVDLESAGDRAERKRALDSIASEYRPTVQGADLVTTI